MSFRTFKSRKKVTESFFSGHGSLSFHMIHKFPGTRFSLSVPLNFFDYNNILISMKKDVEYISVNTVELLSYCTTKWFYIHNVEATVPNFASCSCSKHLVMTACENFAFNWIF